MKKVSNFETYLEFTRNCKNNIVPQSLRLRRPVNTSESSEAIHKAELGLVTARLHECHAVLWKKEVDAFFARQLERQDHIISIP